MVVHSIHVISVLLYRMYTRTFCKSAMVGKIVCNIKSTLLTEVHTIKKQIVYDLTWQVHYQDLPTAIPTSPAKLSQVIWIAHLAGFSILSLQNINCNLTFSPSLSMYTYIHNSFKGDSIIILQIRKERY